MFEMVSFIIISAIVYSTAVNRFNEFPEAAERASFLAITTQLQSGMSLEMMLGLTTGAVNSIQNYENMNPMDFMLKTPSNYLGALSQVATETLPRRSWYFDSDTAELVYLINEADNAFLIVNSTEVPTTEIRFRIVVSYRDPRTGATIRASDIPESGISGLRLGGIVLSPVVPYRWKATEFFSPEMLTEG